MRIRRTQAPVGYRVAFHELAGAAVRAPWTRRYREDVLQPDIAHLFQARTVLAVSSGKAALTLALLALEKLTGRKKVIIPAYTCYSVPSSIVKANLEVVPCDLARGSFDYDYSKLEPMLRSDVLCVLSVHLFGIPSDTIRLKQLCRGAGIFVVEDAAQALGGTSNGKRLGTLGDIGIFSLGRGKNVTCGSGGVVMTDSEPITSALAAVTDRLPRTTFVHDVSTFITLLFLSLFILPRLYWFPAGLPFLRLGETIFHEQFPVRWLSNFQALLLRGWQERLEALEIVRRRNSDYYASHINGAGDHSRGIPCLRFPILLAETDRKRRLLFEQNGTALGLSGMYPATVAAIPQINHRLAETSFPEAELVADSLITLPTHPLVSEADRSRICAVVNAAMGRLPRNQDARMAS